MDHSGAGQGAGMAADALIYSGGGQLFHDSRLIGDSMGSIAVPGRGERDGGHPASARTSPSRPPQVKDREATAKMQGDCRPPRVWRSPQGLRSAKFPAAPVSLVFPCFPIILFDLFAQFEYQFGDPQPLFPRGDCNRVQTFQESARTPSARLAGPLPRRSPLPTPRLSNCRLPSITRSSRTSSSTRPSANRTNRWF